MSRRGNCWDNAPIERLFEWVPTIGYVNLAYASQKISHYLMGYYNWQRPHQHNDGVSLAKAKAQLNFPSKNC